MFENSKRIAISKNFLISLLFVVLIFTSVGVSMDNVCALELNQSVDGIESELNVEDKLENSQENILNTNLEEESMLNVAQDREVLGQALLHGGTFSDIREAVKNAKTGEVIKLAGTFKAEKAYDQIVLNRRVTIMSDSSATLNGMGISHIFIVNATAASYSEFKNLKFINGYRSNTAAGIYVNAHDIAIRNCVFENNEGHHGSAICTPNDNYTARNLLIENCKFKNNHAVTHAGAIVAMAGTFGYELDPRTLSADEKAMIRRQIDFFNRYYDLIQRGMYLRLSDELDEEYYTSWGFVSEDKSEALLNLVVTDVRANPEVIYVLMRNLDPEAMYEVDNCISSCEKVPENDAGEKADVIGQVFSGAALMNAGYAFDPVFGSYPAIQLHFRKKC